MHDHSGDKNDSIGHVNLVDRVVQLRARFLPEVFSETGVYDDQNEVDDMASAFLVLCHAEFEEFIETLARERTQEALTAWSERQEPTAEAMALLAFHFDPDPVKRNAEKQKKGAKKSLPDGGVNDGVSLKFLMNKVVFAHKTAISNNHGIADKNFHALFDPLGLQVEGVDSDFFEDLNSFAANRGKVAHRSISAREAVNPEKIYKQAITIATQLENLTLGFGLDR